MTSEPLPTPTMKGYKFAGWYTWDGQHITNDTVVTMEDDQELTARWKWKGKYPPTAENPEGESLGVEGQINESGATPEGVTANISPIADQVLSELTYGYGAGTQETKTITLVRTGGGDIKNISVSLGGTDAGRFEITQPLKNALDSNTAQTTFTIRVRDGLPIGAFSATVTISADNMADETFTVSQTITPPDTATRQVEIVVYDGDSPVPDAAVTINGNERTTAASGSVMFELADGTYIYEVKRGGYTDARGELSVNENTGTACVLLQKQGQIILTKNGEGLVLISSGGALPDGATLSVSALTPGSSDTAAVQILDENNNIVALFDISLLSGDEGIQLGGEVRIGIPIPAGFDGQTLKIVSINEDGTTTMCDAVVAGNMLFFSADHFSRYAVISVNEEPVNSGTAAGGVFMTILWALLGVAVIAGVILLARLAILKRKS